VVSSAFYRCVVLGTPSASFTMDRYGHLFEDAGPTAAQAVAADVGWPLHSNVTNK